MMKGALSHITDAIGGTPIIQLHRVAEGIKAKVYGKCEFLNPGGSHKDRVAKNLLKRAVENGLKPGGTIVEATSGNTGAALAMHAAVLGYRCVFVMPDKMSQEKIDSLRAFGARVVVCPTAVEADDPRSFYSVAKRLSEETPNCFYANQYHNPANPEAHYLSTGPEIWEQCGAELDAFVTGMGTGGTVSGVGKYLKEKNPNIQLIGVDPVGSLYYDFVKTGRLTQPFSYKVEGIGEDFLPSTMNISILDDIVRVDDKECFLMTRDLVRREGVFVGGSAGAAVAGAIKYAKKMDREMNILVLLPDSAQKYLSKIFNDNWMRENGFLEEAPSLGTVRDILLQKSNHLITASPETSVREAIAKLRSLGISQLPVLDRDTLLGIVHEVDLLRHLVSQTGTLDTAIGPLIESDYATVSPDTKVELLQTVLGQAKLALVLDNGKLAGLVTKIDLVTHLADRLTTPGLARASVPPLTPEE
ncbi:MAG: pyridoxal-phosphate dependent enzyme [Polyangiaceae bacterium]|nr:pyridoxal-phosphate dependent enzyme [Polyangiaceae bacterium]